MKQLLFILVIVLLFFDYSFALEHNIEQDTITTESGLKYIIIEEGSGEKALVGKAVEVHYTGMFTNGKVFDSSIERGVPIEFVLGKGQVIKGWDEGIALMKVGDKMRLIIPPDLAYGEKGAGDVIPSNATLIFDVELMSVFEPKTAIADVMLELILDNRTDEAIVKYYELKQTSSDEYNFKESQLNNLGYTLLQMERIADAIKIFQLNVDNFPKSFNVYDSLGEAYMINGELELAVEYYKRSLDINPNNENAINMIEKINEIRKE